MTLGELRKMVAAQPPVFDHFEVKVWLPGSRITLNASFLSDPNDGAVLMIEGNVDHGSALEGLI